MEMSAEKLSADCSCSCVEPVERTDAIMRLGLDNVGGLAAAALELAAQLSSGPARHCLIRGAEEDLSEKILAALERMVLSRHAPYPGSKKVVEALAKAGIIGAPQTFPFFAVDLSEALMGGIWREQKQWVAKHHLRPAFAVDHRVKVRGVSAKIAKIDYFRGQYLVDSAENGYGRANWEDVQCEACSRHGISRQGD